jgi:hypothetical protein
VKSDADIQFARHVGRNGQRNKVLGTKARRERTITATTLVDIRPARESAGMAQAATHHAQEAVVVPILRVTTRRQSGTAAIVTKDSPESAGSLGAATNSVRKALLTTVRGS